MPFPVQVQELQHARSWAGRQNPLDLFSISVAVRVRGQRRKVSLLFHCWNHCYFYCPYSPVAAVGGLSLEENRREGPME